MTSIFRLFMVVSCLIAVVVEAEDWVPPEKDIQWPQVLPADRLELSVPGAGSIRPSSFVRSVSLNGTWKYSGLTSSAKPFPDSIESEDLRFVSPEFDDSGWADIQVPLNWYLHKDSSYRKMLTPSDRKIVNGESESSENRNPWMKGYYRKIVVLPDPLPPGRITLDFDAIGYEAELFVNGHDAGRHHGDFVPFRADITKFVKPGKNLIALRVLSDFGPGKKWKYTRTYGAKWTPYVIKGGIWQSVRLNFEPEIGIERLLLTPLLSENRLRVDYLIVNGCAAPRRFTPGLVVVKAISGTPVNARKEGSVLVLNPGINTGTLYLPLGKMERWTPETPVLYYAMLYLRDGARVKDASAARFGFRDFRVSGTGFALNGKPVYLIGDSIHSSHFGGYGRSEAEEEARMRQLLLSQKKRGIMILRTAHMPVMSRFLDLADEIGMMIYDEWGFCFIDRLDEPIFEKNNLSELKRFVERDYNHPSVVMWSLGNENNHSKSPEVVRQLDKQYDLVHRLDFQHRPICSFSGMATLSAFGKNKLKTDFLDMHNYHGITDSPWTEWDRVFQRDYLQNAGIYGKNGRLNMPLVIWECIGAGWGPYYDPKFKLEDIKSYLAHMNRDFTGGEPRAVGYSGVAGLAPALDPQRGCPYLMDYLSSRLTGLFREEPRIAGFAPWFVDPAIGKATRWTQPIYPGMRNNATDKLMFRQLFSPGEMKAEVFLLNQNGDFAKCPKMRIELAAGGKIIPLDEVVFPDIPMGMSAVRQIHLKIPRTGVHSGEVRLTVFSPDGVELARNGYHVTLHSPEEAAGPLNRKVPVLLPVPDAGLETILRELNVPWTSSVSSDRWQEFKSAILPPYAELSPKLAEGLRDWVEKGGRLLVLERGVGAVPGFPEYNVTDEGNTNAELVFPSHPVFRNLTQQDFDLWAENSCGYVVKDMLIPLNETALAVKAPYIARRTFGMGAAEAAVGKGRVLISSFLATPLWRRNAAATCYLRNLIAYVTGSETWDRVRPLENKRKLRESIVPERVMVLNLRHAANRGFFDETEGDRKGGWTDQGENDFRLMPMGRQEAAGIPFDIIDPAENQGRSCVVLRNLQHQELPAEVTGIPVGGYIRVLYFLHSAAWGEGGKLGRYRVRYEDRTSADVPIVFGENIGDWWSPGLLPKALPGIVRTNAMGHKIGLFVAKWLNPHPEKKVVGIDMISSERAAMPILVAITAERAEKEPLMVLGSDTEPKIGRHTENGGPLPEVHERKDSDGARVFQLSFPENHGTSVPCILISFDRGKLETHDYHYVTFRFRSDDCGKIDFVLPRSDWSSTLTHTFDLAQSQGRWMTVRLNIEIDFRFTGNRFSPKELRDQVAFYNGKDRSEGFPRQGAAFEISEIEFE